MKKKQKKLNFVFSRYIGFIFHFRCLCDGPCGASEICVSKK